MSTATQGTDTGAVIALIGGICFTLVATLAAVLLLPFVILFSQPLSIMSIGSVLFVGGTGSVGIFLITFAARRLR